MGQTSFTEEGKVSEKMHMCTCTECSSTFLVDKPKEELQLRQVTWRVWVDAKDIRCPYGCDESAIEYEGTYAVVEEG